MHLCHNVEHSRWRCKMHFLCYCRREKNQKWINFIVCSHVWLARCANIPFNVLFYVFKALMMVNGGTAVLMVFRPGRPHKAWTKGLFYVQYEIDPHAQSNSDVCHNNKNTAGGEELNYTSNSGCQTANIQYPDCAAESNTMTSCIYILQPPEGRSLTLVSMEGIKGN